ncbi:MAG: hypothetical protein JWM80_4418 [Cyanobacteria bacterium RYN_339]|nr:hypothetical protein [Cyanobacteria bacterium RYN_339]
MQSPMLKTLVLDVSTEAPADLRRRLVQGVAATVLPGGLQLEEGAGGATYHLDARGGWSAVQIAGEWHFSHPAGHVVVLNDRGLTVTTSQ